MSEKTSGNMLSLEYSKQLEQVYDPMLVDQLNQEHRYADLTHHPDEVIPYTRLHTPETSGRPILFVPGFTETITAKAPLALEMATQGADFILPGQNRTKLLRESKRHEDATIGQARNNLAVLTAEGLENRTVDVVTHSYGSLIFQAMVNIAKEKNISAFNGANVVMLAPAGMNKKEHALTLGYRFAKSMITEGRTKKDFDDVDGTMLNAGVSSLRANIPRAAHEVRNLYKAQVDYRALLESGIGSLMIFGYAQDDVYPSKVIAETMTDAVEAGVGYAVPYSLQVLENGKLRGGQDASHNDDQFNPNRATSAVLAWLRSQI